MKFYPLSYFAKILGAENIFCGRKCLTWGQRIFTSIFLMSLILFPFSLELRGIETYPLDKIIDGVFVPLSDEVMLHLQEAKFKNFSLELKKLLSKTLP